MSFLNPHPVPVTLYASTDPEAPQLGSANWTGAIKTLLKACLVTGYGGKAGAGWAMTDETDHKATFTPQDPQAPPVGLYVDSSNPAHSSFDLVWQGARAGIPDTQTGMRLGRNPARDHATQPWYLVASARGFCFLPGYPYGTFTSHSIVYFGGINHNLDHPAGQDFVFYNAMSSPNGWNCSNLPAVLTQSGSTQSTYLRTAGSLGGQNAAVNGGLRCVNAFGSGSAYPTPLSTTALSSRLYGGIYVSRGYEIIGQLPGLLIPSHRMDSDTGGQIHPVEGSPHDWLFTHQPAIVTNNILNAAGCGLLVNTETWTY